MTGVKPVIIVQGGQWGSEAKGLITHKLTLEKEVDYAIRTGTINAGHTVYHNGKPYAMQQLPVSWVRPGCKLVIGPGAYVHPPTLMRELEWIGDALDLTFEHVLNMVLIDFRCGVHLASHMDKAHEVNRHHSIGTTGKGCSEAVVGKIMGRDQPPAGLPTFAAWLEGKGGFWADIRRRLTDTVRVVNYEHNAGKQILVEGTQGTLLDLHLGSYPYTTHKQTQAASWLAEAGLSCTIPTDLWLVARTYPIKVAGNSGPMPGETSWAKLARTMNDTTGEERVEEKAIVAWEKAMRAARDAEYPEAPSPDPSWWTQEQREGNRAAASEIHKVAFSLLDEETRDELRNLFEFTTVTRKLRRVADWHWPTMDQSFMMNRPDHIALTFMNYKFPELWGAERYRVGNTPTWRDWAGNVEMSARRWNPECRVGIVSFGPGINHTHMAEDVAARATVELTQ